MGKRNWMEKYIPNLLNQKFTLEDVRKIRETELGIPIELKSVKRALNDIGYSLKQIIVGNNEAKLEVCKDCKYFFTGLCISPKNSFEGWQKDFDKEYCPLKV